jgi:hypothetical protein
MDSTKNNWVLKAYHRTYIRFLERALKSPSLYTIMDLAETLEMKSSESSAVWRNFCPPRPERIGIGSCVRFP